MKKILLLEDEEMIGTIYKNSLKENNFYVLWEKKAIDADMVVEAFQPDIVLVDHGMSEGKSGIEIVPSLRKKLPNAKIIMLSNFSRCDYEPLARKAGADDFLVKIETPPDILIQYLHSLEAKDKVES